MGYIPYDVILAQQFPWCGTLRLRGEVAERDVRIALARVRRGAARRRGRSQAGVPRPAFNERRARLLAETREAPQDFLKIARSRYPLGTATQVDVIRADVAISELDRAVARRTAKTSSRPVRARSADPGWTRDAPPDRARAARRRRPDRAPAAGPARDRGAGPNSRGGWPRSPATGRPSSWPGNATIPNVTVGLVYQDMEKTNAMTPATATGHAERRVVRGHEPARLSQEAGGGVHEAEARAAADAKLYEAERDQAHRDVKDLFTQATVQQNVLSLLRRSNLPAAKRILELTASDYRAGEAGVDYLSLIGPGASCSRSSCRSPRSKPNWARPWRR